MDSNNHIWVELQMIPVTVEFDEDETMSVYASDEAIELGEDDKTYLCWVCGNPCNSDTARIECPGKVDDSSQKG